MKLDTELTFAIQLAQEAGAILLRYYQEIHEFGDPKTSSESWVKWKAGKEPVTKADEAVNELCVSKIRAVFPKDGLLTEEMPDDGSRHRAERTWMIDPMDGTKEFIAGRSGFSVMIGLLFQGRPVLGVVYQPVGDALYVALLGEGAYRIQNARKEKIHVSPVDQLSRLRLVRSITPRSQWINEWMKTFRIEDELQIGSIGVKLCLIAADERDAYITTSHHAKLWDTCAPEIILLEAGGALSNWKGELLNYSVSQVEHQEGIVASNGILHPILLKSLQSVGAFPLPPSQKK